MVGGARLLLSAPEAGWSTLLFGYSLPRQALVHAPPRRNRRLALCGNGYGRGHEAAEDCRHDRYRAKDLHRVEEAREPAPHQAGGGERPQPPGQVLPLTLVRRRGRRGASPACWAGVLADGHVKTRPRRPLSATAEERRSSPHPG